jgi:hypothetical protein
MNHQRLEWLLQGEDQKTTWMLRDRQRVGWMLRHSSKWSQLRVRRLMQTNMEQSRRAAPAQRPEPMQERPTCVIRGLSMAAHFLMHRGMQV